MASKKTVTLHNVASLGPDRLAAILVDLAEVDAEVKPMADATELADRL